MKCLNWRLNFVNNFSMLMRHLEIIEASIQSGQPDVYEHLLEQLEEPNMYILFSSKIFTVFISDLQEKYPYVLRTIFDSFLLDGEQVIYTILVNFFDMRKDKILSLEDEDLLYYLKGEMYLDCLAEKPLHEFLELN